MTVPLQQTGTESQGCGRWPTVPKAAGARGNIPCPARGSSPHHLATFRHLPLVPSGGQAFPEERAPLWGVAGCGAPFATHHAMNVLRV